jgi:hypothetical protein
MNEERNYGCLSAAGNAERLNERVERIMEFAQVMMAEGCTRLEVYSYLSGLDMQPSKVKKELEVFKEGGARASGEDALAYLSSHKTWVNLVFIRCWYLAPPSLDFGYHFTTHQ